MTLCSSMMLRLGQLLSLYRRNHNNNVCAAEEGMVKEALDQVSNAADDVESQLKVRYFYVKAHPTGRRLCASPPARAASGLIICLQSLNIC